MYTQLAAVQVTEPVPAAGWAVIVTEFGSIVPPRFVSLVVTTVVRGVFAGVVAVSSTAVMVGVTEFVSVLVQVPVVALNVRVIPPPVTQLVPELVIPGGGVMEAAFTTFPLVAVRFAVTVIS